LQDAYKNDILQNREPKREDNSYKIVIINGSNGYSWGSCNPLDMYLFQTQTKMR